MNKTKLTHRTGSAKISKLLCIAGVAAAGMTLGIAPASATTKVFTAFGQNTFAAPNNLLSAQVIFDDAINPGKLTITLTNLGPAASRPWTRTTAGRST